MGQDFLDRQYYGQKNLVLSVLYVCFPLVFVFTCIKVINKSNIGLNNTNSVRTFYIISPRKKGYRLTI